MKKYLKTLLIIPIYLISLVLCFIVFVKMPYRFFNCEGFGCFGLIFAVPFLATVIAVPLSITIYILFTRKPVLYKNSFLSMKEFITKPFPKKKIILTLIIFSGFLLPLLIIALVKINNNLNPQITGIYKPTPYTNPNQPSVTLAPNTQQIFFTIPTPSTILKTYSNSEYKFSLQYPSNYFINSDGNLMKISNSPYFEKTERAMVIKISIIDKNSLPEYFVEKGEAPEHVEILDKRLSYNEFKTRIKTETFGTFLGDPPWGSYNIFIKHPDYQDKYIKLSITTHQYEDPGYGGNYQDSNTAKQILSTFKFTN